MPQYLSTTQPETLLRLRRLDGCRASNRNGHDSQNQHPNGRLGADQKRMSLNHRAAKPNTSHQSLRFNEAQQSVKRVEDFKRAQFAFGRVIPIRCWSGRLPIASFYRDEYMTQRPTFKRTVSPLSTDGGTTDDDDVDICSNCIASVLHFQEDTGQASSTGHSRSTPPHQHIPRNLVARQPADVDERQPLASAARVDADVDADVDAGVTRDDAVRVGWRARGRTSVMSSPLPQDHNTMSTSRQQRKTDGRPNGRMNAGRN